jgi:hypothetical protein
VSARRLRLGGRLRRIEIDHLAAALAQLFGQIQGLVASARAGGQQARPRPEALLAAEDEMIDPLQRLHRPNHQPAPLLAWIPLGARMLLIKREKVGVGRAFGHGAISHSMAGEG